MSARRPWPMGVGRLDFDPLRLTASLIETAGEEYWSIVDADRYDHDGVFAINLREFCSAAGEMINRDGEARVQAFVDEVRAVHAGSQDTHEGAFFMQRNNLRRRFGWQGPLVFAFMLAFDLAVNGHAEVTGRAA